MPEAVATLEAAPLPANGRSLRGLVRYFFGLGSWGFGGPIALAGYMHRDLVVGRRWYTEDEYQQGLAVSQAMPGPLAAQLAMWLGYLERGWLGALAVALPFVVPPWRYSSPSISSSSCPGRSSAATSVILGSKAS